jgi:hypothetical protein
MGNADLQWWWKVTGWEIRQGWQVRLMHSKGSGHVGKETGLLG